MEPSAHEDLLQWDVITHHDQQQNAGQPGKPEQPAWCSSPLRSILNHQPLLRDCLFKDGEEQESQIRQDVSSNFPEHLILGLLLDMNMSRKQSLANNWHQAGIIKKEI